jgi:hypothetical protein
MSGRLHSVLLPVLVVAATATACAAAPNVGGPATSAAPLPAADTVPVAPARWTTLTSSPLPNQTGFLNVWTGTELLVCCGSPNRQPDAVTPGTAAAFDPATDRWRPIHPPASGAQSWGSVTVIGDTVYLLDGGTQPWAYEAYDITADAWHDLPAPPINATRQPDSRLGTSAWNGHEIFAVLTTTPSVDHDLALVAFDPAADTWRTLPAPPERLEPTSLVADEQTVTLLGERRNPADQHVEVVSLTLDLATGAWQAPKPTGLSRRDPAAIGGGDRLVAWDVTGHVRVQEDGEWRDEPTIPYPEDECGWRGAQVGHRVVLWRCTQEGAVLDTDTGTWSTLPAPPTDLLGDDIVALGDQLVLWARSTDQLQPYRLDLG